MKAYRISVIILGLVGFGYLFYDDWKVALAIFFILWAENVTNNTKYGR